VIASFEAHRRRQGRGYVAPLAGREAEVRVFATASGVAHIAAQGKLIKQVRGNQDVAKAAGLDNITVLDFGSEGGNELVTNNARLFKAEQTTWKPFEPSSDGVKEVRGRPLIIVDKEEMFARSSLVERRISNARHTPFGDRDVTNRRASTSEFRDECSGLVAVAIVSNEQSNWYRSRFDGT